MQSKKFDLERTIERLDTSKVGISISLLTQQIEHALKDFSKQKIALPKRKWANVVYCGMGGSALNADLIRAVYWQYLPVPMQIVRGYHIPAYASKNSLVVICSYSGTTDEAISCFKEARKRKLPTFIIASGGTLARLARTHRVPNFIFTPTYNPSKQPRIGTGYTLACLFILFRKTILQSGDFDDLARAITKAKFDPGRSLSLAQKTKGNSFIIIAAEHLSGNAHIMSNQMNETAKVFAPYFLLSELNHHLLEGFGSLKKAMRSWIVFVMESDLYDTRIQKRVQVTKHVLKRQGFRTESIKFSGTRVEQALKAAMFSSWFSYYQGMLLGYDPASIPWVDYFKKQL